MAEAPAPPAGGTLPAAGERQQPARYPSFLAQVLRIVIKDLRIEWRSREIVYTMAFLAVVVVLIFSFAFVVGDARPPPAVTAGILWIAVIVSGTVGLGRTFDREREGEAIRSLLLSPAPRAAIYLGKLAATVVLMLAVELVLVTLCGFLFTSAIAAQAGRIAVLLGLGTIGFAAAGCVFSAALLRSRSRDVLLSTLLYPIIVPIVIAGARGTSQVLDLVAPDFDGAAFWMQFLATLDAIFLTVGLWAFEPVAAGE
ncbi:MAG TPA: heme exporter protein CcmB [Polyangia bacterium]|nr:heme exporter protein CcmB [Polyangia bacterium]